MADNWRGATWTISPSRLQQNISTICRYLEAINFNLGRTVAWLSLAMALIVFIVVVARYGFDSGSIKGQEAVIYMHAMLFMLCGAYCFQQGMHVRIDVFYAKMSPQRQTLVDILGTLLLLLPSCIFIFYISLDYVGASWSYRESSTEPGGLPYLYLLKTLLLLMPAVIFLQGITDLWRHYFFLKGWISYKERENDLSSSDPTSNIS
ncbi:MAG: TRAP transporter small permease subunit [Candidatus Portiera sp.]|nr:TRAP transporter small permease subunit [Portiera sp.]